MASHGNSLEVFAAHNSPESALTGGAFGARSDDSVTDQVLSGWADGRHASLTSQFLCQALLRLDEAQSPQVLSIANLDLLILYPEVDRLRRTTRDYQAVVACILEFSPPVSAQVCPCVPLMGIGLRAQA